MKKIIFAVIISAFVIYFLPAYSALHEYGHAFFAMIVGIDPSAISFPEDARTHISVGMNAFQEALICQGGWLFEIGAVFALLIFRKSQITLGITTGLFLNTVVTVIASIVGSGGDFRHPYSWLGVPFAILLQTVAASSIILAIRGQYVRLQRPKQSTPGRKLPTIAKVYR